MAKQREYQREKAVENRVKQKTSMGKLALGEREDEGGFESRQLSQLSKRSRHVQSALHWSLGDQLASLRQSRQIPFLTATDRRLKPSLVFDQGIQDWERRGAGGGTWWILKTLARQSKLILP
ncbi:hypothetical protein V2G26_019780 [Clonostachys chloroleuca]